VQLGANIAKKDSKEICAKWGKNGEKGADEKEMRQIGARVLKISKSGQIGILEGNM
jgi:hypothetical protein